MNHHQLDQGSYLLMMGKLLQGLEIVFKAFLHTQAIWYLIQCAIFLEQISILLLLVLFDYFKNPKQILSTSFKEHI